MFPPTSCYAFIEKYEGRKTHSYLCPAGKWTIGVGHTGPDVHEGMIWEDDRIEEFFHRDVAIALNNIDNLVHVTLSPNQWTALISFVFNLGSPAFKTSTLLELINENKLDLAAQQFPKWDHGHVNGHLVEIKGLLTRRLAEQALFVSK